MFFQNSIAFSVWDAKNWYNYSGIEVTTNFTWPVWQQNEGGSYWNFLAPQWLQQWTFSNWYNGENERVYNVSPNKRVSY